MLVSFAKPAQCSEIHALSGEGPEDALSAPLLLAEEALGHSQPRVDQSLALAPVPIRALDYLREKAFRSRNEMHLC